MRVGRAKKLKIDEKDVVASFNGQNDIVLASQTGEELETENLNKKIVQMMEKYDSLDISVKEYKAPRTVNRKPIIKYECNCGKLIKSEYDKLEIKCKSCDSDFIIQE